MRSSLSILVVAALAGGAEARPCSFYGSNGPSVYNLATSFDANYQTKARAAGVTGLRVNFRVDTQPNWDATILAAYDKLLWDAYTSGFEVLGLINNEAVAAGQDVWNAPPNTVDGRNDYTQMFVDATKVLFERYGDQIKYWEIWNEPNACSSDSLATCERNPQTAGGSFLRADLYAKLLAEVWVQNYGTIQAKGLHLVTAGLYAHDVGGNGVVYAAADYMNEVYGNSVWTWFQQHYNRSYPWDAFGYHIYTTLYGRPVAASTINAYLDGIGASRAAHGDASPIWMTEFGWLTPMVSEAQQAQNLDTEYGVLEGRSEVERAFVFRLDEWQGWGAYRDDWSAKPAAAVLAQHASGCTPVPLPQVMDLAGVSLDAAGAVSDAAEIADAGTIADAGPGSDGNSNGNGSGAVDASLPAGAQGGGGCAMAGGPAASDGALLLVASLFVTGWAYRRRPSRSRRDRRRWQAAACS